MKGEGGQLQDEMHFSRAWLTSHNEIEIFFPLNFEPSNILFQKGVDNSLFLSLVRSCIAHSWVLPYY